MDSRRSRGSSRFRRNLLDISGAIHRVEPVEVCAGGIIIFAAFTLGDVVPIDYTDITWKLLANVQRVDVRGASASEHGVRILDRVVPGAAEAAGSGSDRVAIGIRGTSI
jgi:hypothetical protein